MSESYEENGYDSDNFKRNVSKNAGPESSGQDGDSGAPLNEKASEYLREMLNEKIKLDSSQFPVSTRLLDQEVTKLQANGRMPAREFKYVDVYREKPTKVVVKVLLPLKEHPKFNFVGKLLGPKGNTLKQLQEETMCKMAVLGKGSMRDRQKEEELRNSLDPKYAHLTDELHVEISALAPPAEAHARIAYALAEVKKYIIPDTNDNIRQAQMRDIIDRGEPSGGRALLADPGPVRHSRVEYSAHKTPRSLSYQDPILSNHVALGPRQGAPVRGPPRMPPGPQHSRPVPPSKKVISILDRARNAMESSYSPYEDYGMPEPPIRGPPRSADPYYGYERSHDRYYEDEYYKEPAAPREYKPSPREVGSRRAVMQPRHFSRASPYSRPPK